MSMIRVYIVISLILISLAASAQNRAELETAHRKGDRSATLQLARLAFEEYDTEGASEYLDTYRRSLRKGRKSLPDASGDLEDRITLLETMLGAVEDVAVIDSVIVDKNRFFEAYRLSPDAGTLSASTALPRTFRAADETVVYAPYSRRNMIWGAPVKADGDTVPHVDLFTSYALYGDEMETPALLGEELARGGNANYPFMLADGVTLYYASDGEGSLGGYDIFRTRRDEEGFLEAQNIGLPYNSPYDDYMLAIDETTGVGWWATDRNQIPGKLTLYIFVPNDIRSNVTDEDEDVLLSRARLDAIRDTWREGADYGALRRAIAATTSGAGRTDVSAAYGDGLSVTMPDGRVCYGPADLRSRDAADAWRDYADLYAGYVEERDNLAALRAKYNAGDRSAARQIQQSEGAVESIRVRLAKLANTIVKLESK